MKKIFSGAVLSISVAIFSMFFGAGNIVFPLQLGLENQSQYLWAFLGLFITAIGGPLLGLLAGTLLKGNCKSFFLRPDKKKNRIVKTLGYTLLFVTLAINAPVIVLPRCITVSYGAFSPFFPSVSLGMFSIIFSLLTILCCWKHRYILPILGNVLSPALLACLLAIIFQCWSSDVPMINSGVSEWNAFSSGFSTGYYTMDLIASVYFSAGIWTLIKLRYNGSIKETVRTTLTTSAIACAFLAFIYFGLCHAAAVHSTQLMNIAPENLLSSLAVIALGPKLSIIANIAVALACLTTVISLVMTTSDILCKELFPKKLSYHGVVFLTIGITIVMTQLGFEGLLKILHPIMLVCYPIMILLALKNIYLKLSGNNKILNVA